MSFLKVVDFINCFNLLHWSGCFNQLTCPVLDFRDVPFLILSIFHCFFLF